MEVETVEDRITKNMNLVPFFVRKVQPYGSEDFEDLLSEGYVYLTMAAQRFDPARGVKFSTFAASYIQGGIQKYLRDKTQPGGMRIPRSVLDNRNKLRKYATENNIDITSNDDIEHIKKEIGITDIGPIACDSLSKSLEPKGKEKLKLEDTIPDKDNFDEAELNCDMKRFLVYIETNEHIQENWRVLFKVLLKGYYNGNPLLETEVAKQIGMSQAQVSRVKKKLKNIYKTFMEKGE